MTQRFHGKIVLVTGGGSGIGRATALAFAAEGATVVVAGRREIPLKETVELITASGGVASLVTTDVAEEDQVRQLMDTVSQRHGRLDIAVNNAGVIDAGTLDEFDLARWDRLSSINVTGVLLAMKHQIRTMKAQGAGSIVNIGSSLGAHSAMPGMSAYSATKAAVTALSQSAALDHVRDGVRINVVSPGPIDTAMTLEGSASVAERDARLAPLVPLGRVGRAEEVATAVLYLADPGSTFTVGHDLVVDGGAVL